MSTPELATELPRGGGSPKRVVEAEFRLPKIEEIQLPEIDLEPILTAAERVLLTSIGIGVLVVRGLTSAVKAAHQAGLEAAQEPGSVTNTLLGLIHRPEKASPATHEETRVKVPVLPIDDYDHLTVDHILERLADLSAEELRLLRAYEGDHQARDQVLEAIEQRLSES